MVSTGYEPAWLLDSGMTDAALWEPKEGRGVSCQLCPRACSIQPGRAGFCRARYNDRGTLKSLIWGKLLVPSIEPIETEAVFHFWPGERILSIGNLGCNLRCDFCQNWESSDIKNISKEHVRSLKPDQIVALAKDLGIRVISFTYNDPAIWFEFVMETAKIARKEGVKTLFKSASYISQSAATSLTEVIDVFSISLKTINPDTFRRISQGSLQPVLDSLKIYHRSGRHLEVSNLVVTGLTDVEEEILEISRWIRDELSEEIPLHFVRFHPSYKYQTTERTPIAFLERSRSIARNEGLRYVYIGNTYRRGHADIRCPECESLLVERFGLSTRKDGLTWDGRCKVCGSCQAIELAPPPIVATRAMRPSEPRCAQWRWRNEDARMIHVKVSSGLSSHTSLVCRHLDAQGVEINRDIFTIPPRANIRIAVGQLESSECALELLYEHAVSCEIVELQDRAHFPLEAAV